MVGNSQPASPEAQADIHVIRVWRFRFAPKHLRDLSRHGGDEDWLALVPAYMADEYIPWLEAGPFGSCDVSRDETDEGVVFIGAHS